MPLMVVFLLLVLPAWHQVHGHNVHRKLLRAVRRSGPEAHSTPHEHAHAARPAHLRVLADAAWLAYIAASLVIGLRLAS